MEGFINKLPWRKDVTPEILINPELRWACVTNDIAKLKFLDGMGHAWPTLPEVNSVLTVPFIVNPATQLPEPVVVVEIRKTWETTKHVMVVVVAVANQKH